MRFNHVGIPTTARFEGEIDLPHLKVTVSDHENNRFGIQWMRYWEGAPYPDLVKTVAHVAFEVDDLDQELRGQDVIIPPNSPSAGVRVAFIKVAGAPVELLQIESQRMLLSAIVDADNLTHFAMPEVHPNAGDVVIWDLEPEGAERIFWVRTQARGSETPLFDGPDGWLRARAAAEDLAAATERAIWLRHRDGRFERLMSNPALEV